MPVPTLSLHRSVRCCTKRLASLLRTLLWLLTRVTHRLHSIIRFSTMASMSRIKRPPCAFLLFRSFFHLMFIKVFVDRNTTWCPSDDSYPHPLPYDLNEWHARECNSALISSLEDRLRSDIHPLPDTPAAKFFATVEFTEEGTTFVEAEFSPYATAVWRDLSAVDRAYFTAFQKESKVVHTRMFPGWVFQPAPPKPKRTRDGDSKDEQDEEGNLEAPASKRRKTKTKPARVRSPRNSQPRSGAATTTKPAARPRQSRAKRAPVSAPDLPTPSSSSSHLAHTPSRTGPVTPTAASPSPSPPTRQPVHLPSYLPPLARNAYGSYQTSSPYSDYGSFDSASRSGVDMPVPVSHPPHLNADFDKRYSHVPPSYAHWTGTGTPSTSSASSFGGSPHGIAPAPLPYEPYTCPGDSGLGYNAYASYANNVTGLSYTSVAQVSPLPANFVDPLLGSSFMPPPPLNSTASPQSPLSPLDAALGLGPGGFGADTDGFDMHEYHFDTSTVGMGFGTDATVPGFDGFEAGALDYNFEANEFGFNMGAPAPDYDLGVCGNGGAYFVSSGHGLEMTNFAFDANAPAANFGA
ncbi:hypothetical protein PENSPDRAFT_468514 [Peniophora sp. CONT]|nr:hypothetical protein PENSPDRAFT_468514 [Peniophora sp. CONT]